MNTDFIASLAKELAGQINRVVNIPLVTEENEQAFFEMVVMLILSAVLEQFDKKGLDVKR